MNRKMSIQIGYTVDKTGLQQLQSQLQQIVNLSDSAGSGINNELKKAGETAQKLDSILGRTFNVNLGSLNIAKFNQELSKAGMSLDSVQSDLSGAGSLGVSTFSRLGNAILGTNLRLKESNKFLDSMATTFVNTIKWTISSGFVNKIAQEINHAFSYAQSLDKSLNNIRITTQKSAQEMAQFAQKANQAAQTLGASTLDITGSSLIYYNQGLDTKEVEERTRITTEVANVTGQTASAVSEELTAVWNGYAVATEEAELYVDKMAATAASNATSLAELANAMSKVASTAKATGVTIDQLNAQIATIISVTRQAPESVGTALKVSAL